MPANHASHKSLADMFIHARDHYEGMEPLRELVAIAVKLHPHDFSLVKMMGEILYYQGEHEKALPWLQQAAKQRPRDSDLNAELGVSLYALKRFAEAVPYLKKTLALYPRDEDQQMMLGYALYKAGRAGEAARHLRTALNGGLDFRQYAGEITELALAGLARKPAGAHPAP